MPERPQKIEIIFTYEDHEEVIVSDCVMKHESKLLSEPAEQELDVSTGYLIFGPDRINGLEMKITFSKPEGYNKPQFTLYSREKQKDD